MRVCPRFKQKCLDDRSYGESGIYHSCHRLCVKCWEEEDIEISERGTNNLPDTLEKYGPCNDFY